MPPVHVSVTVPAAIAVALIVTVSTPDENADDTGLAVPAGAEKVHNGDENETPPKLATILPEAGIDCVVVMVKVTETPVAEGAWLDSEMAALVIAPVTATREPVVETSKSLGVEAASWVLTERSLLAG